ncbi:hypothetical protein, partial [Microcoleus sp. OTE_8_concoct_300]|uniref:hypothetical protein n=1 Tax=Microcoleus sp. OTE_8_concoct_300 TaxID=2964710 RepID=UPI00403F1E4C
MRSHVFLGEATYHLKKTKPLSEAQKEAVCIVNMMRGIEIFSLRSGPGNIVATWEFNNLARDRIGVLALPLVTRPKVVRVKNPEDCREI